MYYIVAYEWKDKIRFKVTQDNSDSISYIGDEDRHIVSNIATSLRITLPKGMGRFDDGPTKSYLSCMDNNDWDELVECIGNNTDDEFEKSYMRHVIKGSPKSFRYYLEYDGTKNKEPEDPCYLYVIGDQDNRYIKIGIAKDVESRLSAHQTSNPVSLDVWISVKLDNRVRARELEQSLHNKYEEFNTRGEWFYAFVVDDLVENRFKKFRLLNR